MDYIDAAEIIKLPEKVQEVLIDFYNKYHNQVGKAIPLFTETELRRFIEQKLDRPNIYYNGKELSVEYEFHKGTEDCDVDEINVECEDMLEGYFKIACIVARMEAEE